MSYFQILPLSQTDDSALLLNANDTEVSVLMTYFLFIVSAQSGKMAEVQDLGVGQVAQAARRWATGWTARVRSRVSEG